MSTSYHHMSPFLPASDADNMLRIAEAFGSFGTYANESTSEGMGEELPQRFDAAMNYISGGIDGEGNTDEGATASSRTNYFRETYAYGTDIQAGGIEAFMNEPALMSAAHKLAQTEYVVPAIVYANLHIPGQELAIHTDVPEFLGANRKLVPQWLLVCMLHSGLFEQWRVPILTCVSWFGGARGGAFTFYPAGAGGVRESIPAAHNTAIVLDTDLCFHGVERVDHNKPDLPVIGKYTRLHYCGAEQWQIREGDAVLADYSWSQIRYSISWKAYCFANAQEKSRWESGADDLSLAYILSRLEDDLRQRGAIGSTRPDATEFAITMVNNYVKFPGSLAA